MSLFHEHRLLFKRLEDVTLKPGSTKPSVAQQIQYSPRVAQANSAAQGEQLKESLRNKGAIVPTAGLGEAQYNNTPVYFGGAPNEAGDNIAYYQSTPVANPSVTRNPLAPSTMPKGPTTPFSILNQAAGNVGNTYAFDTKSGDVYGAIPGAMGKPGTSGFNPSVSSLDEQILKLRQGMGGGYSEAGTPESGAQKAQRGAADQAALTELMRQRQILQQDEQNKQDRSAKSSAANASRNAASNAAGSQPTPQTAGLQAAIAQLPPEFGYLGPLFQGLMSETQNALSEQQGLAATALENTRQAYDSVDAKIKTMEDNQLKVQGAIDGMLQQSKQQNEKYLSQELSAQNQRLSWDADRTERDLRKAQQKTVDQKIAALALRGGFGSSAGQSEIDQASMEFENKIADLRMEVGVQRTELSAKFAGLYNQVQQNYYKESIQNLKDTVGALERVGFQSIASTKARADAENNILENLVNKTTETRMGTAKEILGLGKEVAGIMKEERKSKLNDVIATKDTISFMSGLRKEVGDNKIIQNARNVMTNFSGLQAEYNRSLKAVSEGKAFTDQTMISLFNKILDPTSVVREAEYNRTPENQSLGDQAWSLFQKYEKGGVLNPDVRKELFAAAQTLNNAYQSQLQQEVQPYLASMDMFNSQPGLQTKVQLTDVFPTQLVSLPESTLSLWRSQMGIAPASGVASTPGFLPPENAPPGGYRTDRHNNPTAFTVDIARQAGLVEGVDYVRGDSFGSGVTAKLLGDPVAQTIRVIDNVGFHTGRGGQRWSHTAMPKNSWDSLTFQQKSDVVAQMYQREGGTGVLVGQGMPTTQPTTVAQQAEPLIPTAHAADYPPQQPPSTTGKTLQVATAQPRIDIQPKVLGAYRDITTGEILYPTHPNDVEWYRSHPNNFKDLAQPETPSKPPAQIAGGKKIDLLSKK